MRERMQGKTAINKSKIRNAGRFLAWTWLGKSRKQRTLIWRVQTGSNWGNVVPRVYVLPREMEQETLGTRLQLSAGFKVDRSFGVDHRQRNQSEIFIFILTKMRRSTLGTLNIGNQNRQIVRERKTSLGTRPSIGGRRPSLSGRASLANPRSRFVLNFQV